MAKTGISAFTTQEALNYDAYQDWNYEELNLGTALGGYASSSYITVNNPAKQIVIYPRPGETLAANDNLYIYMNDTLADSTSLAAEAMDNSETDFDVDDGDDFTAGDVILVNAELMYVSSIATNIDLGIEFSVPNFTDTTQYKTIDEIKAENMAERAEQVKNYCEQFNIEC